MDKGESNLYHSWIYGGVYFLPYSTEHNFSIGSPQYEFIINDLEKNVNQDIKWRILYGHSPIYCSTDDYMIVKKMDHIILNQYLNHY